MTNPKPAPMPKGGVEEALARQQPPSAEKLAALSKKKWSGSPGNSAYGWSRKPFSSRGSPKLSEFMNTWQTKNRRGR